MLEILMKGKVETVTADHVKPALIERKPVTDSTQQRQTNPKLKPMAQKSTAIAREPRTALAPSSSTTTLKSLGTGVNMDKSTNAQAPTLRVGTVPAIAKRRP